MVRKDFKQIIKLRSIWKMERRKGNFILPSGETLRDYVKGLVDSQMKIDGLGIQKNGNLCACTGGGWNEQTETYEDFTLFPEGCESENCSREEMDRRKKKLVSEITG